MGKISGRKQQQVKLAKQFFDKGTDLWYSYEYEEALVEMTKALVIRESILGKHHLQTAKTYFSMGCAYHADEKYSQALVCLRRTLRIHLYRQDQPSIKSTQDYITWCLMKKNELASDEQCVMYHTKLAEAVRHEQTGDELAEGWDHDGALEEYNLAVEEEIDAIGTTHVDIADLYVKIADVLILNGNDDDAFTKYKQAVAIYKGAFGEDHPYTQTTLEKMDPTMAETKEEQQQKSAANTTASGKKNGMLHKQISMQDLLLSDKNAHLVDKAVKHIHRDRTEFRNTHKGLYDTDGRYFWWALGFFMHKNYAEALVAFRRTWRIRSKVYGREHQQTQYVLDYITQVLKKQKNQQGPIIYLQKLFQAVDLEMSGDALRETRQVVPALRDYLRAAALEESAVGKHHLEYAELKGKIGDLLVEKGDYDKSLDEYRIALLIYQSAFGRGHHVTKTIFKKMDAVCETEHLLLAVSSHGVNKSKNKLL